MKLQPLNDNVLIRPDESEKETPGGIILPDVAQKKQYRGEVLAVGEGKLNDLNVREPVAVSPGDRVLFTKWEGHEVEWNNEKLMVVSEDNILAVER